MSAGRPIHFMIVIISASVVLPSLAATSSLGAVGGSNSWVHTTRQDFANGTGWNVDIDSSPGDVVLPASRTTWIESAYNPGLRQGPASSWDGSGISSPVVIKENGTYKMWYGGDDSGSGSYRIGYAISGDGVNWSKPRLGLVNYHGSVNNNIVLDLGGSGSPDENAALPGTVIHDGGVYRKWYSCRRSEWAICYALSTDGLVWSRHSGNPVIEFGGSMGAVSPAVVKDAGGFHMWFAKSGGGPIYRTVAADSSDGFTWMFTAPGTPQPFGPAGGWNESGILPGTVMSSSSTLQMWFSGVHGSVQSIGFAESSEGTTWTDSILNPIIEPGTAGLWDSVSLSRPWVIRDGLRYRMWFAGFDGGRWSIGTASSAYGERIAPPKTNPVLPVGDIESWDSGGVFRPSVLVRDGTYHMWYTGSTSANGSTGFAIGHATSTDGVSWRKSRLNPVLSGSGSGWDGAWAGFAWVVWDGSSNEFLMWYTGSDGTAIRVGMATSADGDHWQRDASNPVTYHSWQSWFNETDVRCPWVGPRQGEYVMYVGTQSGGSVSITEANSSDGGRSWQVIRTDPLVSPRPGTWEGASVSCPSFIEEGDYQFQKLWYGGSRDSSIAGGGGIGLVGSNNYGADFTRPSVDSTFSGTRPWDAEGAGGPAVIRDGSSLRLWFHGTDGERTNMGMALSRDGVAWHESFAEPAAYGAGPWPGPYGAYSPVVLQDSALAPRPWIMFYSMPTNGTWMLKTARSADGRHWGDSDDVSVFEPAPGGWEVAGRRPLAVLKRAGLYQVWYAGLDALGRWSIGHATASYPEIWHPSPENPVVVPGQAASWDCDGMGGATVISPGLTNTFEMWYSGYDGSKWRIGFLHSADGVHWSRKGAGSVLNPAGAASFDSLGVSSPSVLLENGVYHAFYSGYDGAIWSLGQAFSMNGIDWVKSRINPILGGRSALARNRVDVSSVSVVAVGSTYRFWLSDAAGENGGIGYVEGGFLSVGTFISSPVDSGSAAPTWTSLNAVKSSPPFSSATISIRTGVPPFTNAVWAPEATGKTFKPQAGRDRYLQYRLTLVSMLGDETPIVSEIGGEYEANLAPTAEPLNPSPGSCSASVMPTFAWRYSDPQGDRQSTVEIEVASDPSFSPSSITGRMTAFTSSTAFPSTSELRDRTWYWRLRAADDYGLTGAWSEGVMFTTDTMPPRTRLETSAPQAGIYISPSTRLSLNATDDSCGVRATSYAVDNGPVQSYASPFTLGAGYHVVKYSSEDVAGNSENVTSQAFWVDATPPATALEIVGETVQNGSVTYVRPQTELRLTAMDTESDVQTTQYAFDSLGSWSIGTSAFPLGMSGPHVFNYRSIDRVGNVEAAKSLDVFVDGSPPTTTLTIEGQHSGGSPILVTPSTRFVLNATDGGVGVNGIHYMLDDSVIPMEYDGNLSIAADGFHTLRYYAVDLLNTAEKEHVLRVIVDGQGPATALIPLGPSYSTPARTYIMSTTALTLASMDGGSGLQDVRYRIDNGAWRDYSSAFNITSQGPHMLSFYGVDVLGNVEQTRTLNLFVDDEPPITRTSLVGVQIVHDGLTYVDDAASVVLDSTDSGSGVLFINYRVDGGSWFLYSHPFSLSGSGAHIVDVQAIDNLGLTESPHSLKVVVDDSAPVARAGQDLAVFAPSTVSLDGSASTDDIAVVSFEWAADWNGTVVCSSARCKVKLDTPGNYTLRLIVRDPIGRESTDTLMVKVLTNPDSDGDSIPDVWERQQYGNLTYGPDDDPNGDGSTVLDDYQNLQGGRDSQGGPGGAGGTQGNTAADALTLFLYALLGTLAGVVVLQRLKNRELKRNLEDLRAEQSISVDEDEE